MKLPELLKTKRFTPLLITQFLGAFNDNLFKNMLLTLIAFRMTAQAGILSNVVAGLFVLPFFLFSALAGQIADKYNRAKIARILKITELILMIFVGVVFTLQSVYLLILLLFLMGTQSAFFGPIKYALLPQLLKTKELVGGNAYIEATTYLAIILGLVMGTLLPIGVGIAVLVICAIIGYGASRFIPDAPAPRQSLKLNFNIIKQTIETLKLTKRYELIFRCILGATWFWTIGALMVVQVYPLTAQTFKGSELIATFFLVLFSIGVGVGSLTCEKILHGFIHTTFVPISAIGMAVCSFVLYALTADYVPQGENVGLMTFLMNVKGVAISVSFFMLAFFGGLYIVPLNTLMQYKAPQKYMATIIGANNILNALGMVGISLAAIVLLALGLSVPQLFLFIGIVSVLVSVYICLLLPDALVRSIMQTVLKLLFRVRVFGMENFKKTSRKTVIIANHTSLLDALLVAAFLPEKVTFAINTEWAHKWFIKPFALLVDLFAMDPTNPMAIRGLIEQAQKNKKIMIFPEGRITVTGGLMKIYDGAAVLADKAGADVLPLRIENAVISKFSYMGKKTKTFFFPKIRLHVLAPEKLQVDQDIKGRARRQILSRQLYDIMTSMIYKTSNINQNLFLSLSDSAERFGFSKVIAEDASRKKLKYKDLILKAYVLGEAYKKAFLSEKIGLMLPNTLANIVSFYALQSVDKVPVMMNFSHGAAQIASCVKTVRLDTVITSRQFIDLAHLQAQEQAILSSGAKVVYLEDFAKKISFITKLRGLQKLSKKEQPKNSADKTAVVLFTSGSEGMPKAVFLSHKNIQANRYQLASVLAFNASDVVMNALPMFHSFGLTIGGVVTILSGIKTFYYPSPLHYRIVPELFYDINATIICGTDTFFYGYGRRANPYDFYNTKYAIVGGEKLKDKTNQLWLKKFGIRILEGYGATETSPVIALNTPMYLKEGTVGRLLPAMQYRLEAVKGINEAGRLLVCGDNVMQGYMRPEKPAVLQPVQNGWYDTGDIVSIDEEGYISITGRAKRFAKIGGEMVSLSAVEQTLEKLYPDAKQGILTRPDDRKGEQLILLTNLEGVKISDIRAFFKSNGISELWTPKQVVYMKKPPLLGTGKFDYVTADKIIDDMLK